MIAITHVRDPWNTTHSISNDLFEKIKHRPWYKENIHRPYILGNPFAIGRDGNRAEVIEKFRVYLNKARLENSRIWKRIIELSEIYKERNIILVCFCAPKPCHGDVIKKAILWVSNSQGGK